MPYTLRDWLTPADARFTQSLAGVARRTMHGEDFLLATRELLDEFALTQTPEQRMRALSDEPPGAGSDRFDAYVAALREHLSVHHGLIPPHWTQAQSRFLQHFWFVRDVK